MHNTFRVWERKREQENSELINPDTETSITYSNFNLQLGRRCQTNVTNCGNANAPSVTFNLRAHFTRSFFYTARTIPNPYSCLRFVRTRCVHASSAERSFKNHRRLFSCTTAATVKYREKKGTTNTQSIDKHLKSEKITQSTSRRRGEVGAMNELQKKKNTHTENDNYAQTLKPMQQPTDNFLFANRRSREASANMNLICNKRHAQCLPTTIHTLLARFDTAAKRQTEREEGKKRDREKERERETE